MSASIHDLEYFRLMESVFSPAFGNPLLNRAHDGAITPPVDGRLAFSTETFAEEPLFFNGGNIGDLAVNRTVNFLLCCGSKPRYISAGFVVEEGFETTRLKEIVDTMAAAARQAEVEIVTGDIKVVQRGRCGGVYITTSGIGEVPPNLYLDPANLQPGDKVIITGPIANHGIAVMSQREDLRFEGDIKSDTASLGDVVANLLDVVPGENLRVLLTPTRGGLATIIDELSEASGVDIEIAQSAIPIHPAVEKACALLGLDPLFVENEGVMVAVVSSDKAEAALAAVRRSEHGSEGAIIGEVKPHSANIKSFH